MLVIVANSKTDRAATFSGVVVVHSVTGNPVAFGKTALSGTLLKAYREGFGFSKYDTFMMEVNTILCPPMNMKIFSQKAPEYFAHAGLVIRVLPWETDLKVMEIGLTEDLSPTLVGGERIGLVGV